MLARKKRSFCSFKEGRSKSLPKRQIETMASRQSIMGYIVVKTTNDTKHSVDKQIVRLFYALTSHVANNLDFRKIVEAFSNHWHYLHLAHFLVQCTANLKIDSETQKQRDLHFDTECSVTIKNLIIVCARYRVLVHRAMRFLPVFT